MSGLVLWNWMDVLMGGEVCIGEEGYEIGLMYWLYGGRGYAVNGMKGVVSVWGR